MMRPETDQIRDICERRGRADLAQGFIDKGMNIVGVVFELQRLARGAAAEAAPAPPPASASSWDAAIGLVNSAGAPCAESGDDVAAGWSSAIKAAGGRITERN
jgi:hypothetical protein